MPAFDGGPPTRDAGLAPVDSGPVRIDGAVADAGAPDSGAVTPLTLADYCGDPSAALFVDTTDIFTVDTRALTNNVASCGGRSAPGHDGFVRIQANGGDRWHFHVSSLDADRDPFLYLLDSACFSTECDNSSDSCRDNGDEHFTFTAPGGGGTFFLGIDDRNPGGGSYRVAAYRLECGEAGRTHGEACDETTATCVDCHRVITGTAAAEDEVNDNEVEANRLMFPAGNTMNITGNLGGAFCVYPDVFEFTLAANANLAVSFLRSDSLACDSPLLTPFDAILRSSSGVDIAGPATDGAGCATLTANNLPAGRYRIWLIPEEPLEDRFVNYTMHATLTY